MKKIYFLTVLFAGVILSSCKNDEIGVDLKEAGKLSVTVSPSDFFSCYDYVDTKNLKAQDQLAERFRTFNSAQGYFIELRSMIYNKETDLLVDSVVTKLTNTNSYSKTVELPVGQYTVVSTLSFNVNINGRELSLWQVADREKLSTAKMLARSRNSEWCILSVATDDVTVKGDAATTFTTTPHPVGALVYTFFENFQFNSELTYGTVVDTGYRQLALYTQETAISYNLSPKATNKVNYFNEGVTNQWRAAIRFTANDYFKKNVAGYAFLLEPQAHLCFGSVLKDEIDFNKYGEQTVTLESGNTYMAYWDHFQMGNPYFGKADNNVFHSYSK